MRFLPGLALMCVTCSACSPQEQGSGTESTTSNPSTDSTATSDSTTVGPTNTATSEPTSGTGTGPVDTTDGASSSETVGTTDATGSTSTGPVETTDDTASSETVGTTDATGSTSTGPVETTDDTSSTTGVPLSDCDFLVGKEFESDEMLECGLSPMGVVLCHWSIKFTADSFDHILSDYGLQGPYTCVDGVIEAFDLLQDPHGGTIDAATGELVWDDHVYHPA
ncbi:hypothetical protein OV090_11730 [Nannocystis sp. RBIL2]|uniref:hypothetical protein n=1 Tax=Nannocystis sp. RBIL2 TaxID=2996788 RepID=UPI00226D9FC7|nr:hypothetical protein [Nannocystis sp. RBIL2]MCY1065438.1 hypothetical protein [Nannocystis sp. RBIL2]